LRTWQSRIAAVGNAFDLPEIGVSQRGLSSHNAAPLHEIAGGRVVGMVTSGFVEGRPDWDKRLTERLRWWVAVACSKGTVTGPWRALLLLASLLGVLPPSLRGRLLEVVPPGTDRGLWIRLGSSDLRILEDLYLVEEYRWPLASAPDVVIDAGAYTGLSTAYFAMRYPNATIIAIEPSAANYELLERNTAGLEHVQLVQAALWHETGTLDLVDPGFGAYAYRVGQSTPCAQREHVQAVTLSDVLDRFALERVDLCKVDIEGSEIEVFMDASSWIGRVDALCLELHDRLRPGCSRTFFQSVSDFATEQWRGESVLVTRRAEQLVEQG
jgi:FkbM family methyltransferase